MSIGVVTLTPDHEPAYEALLREAPSALLAASLRYRDFLRAVTTEAEDHYLVALEGDRLVGALPCFIKRHPLGNVLNSLPFYGTNGGPIVAPGFDLAAVHAALRGALEALVASHDVSVSVVISNPLAPCPDFWPASLQDERIGQLTPLPAEGDLMELYHYKTRNAVRKGLKSDLVVKHDPEALPELAELHAENLAAIGGLAKPWSVFAAIQAAFRYDEDYRVYVARHRGELVAALLVFFHHHVAEYFTPATREAFRELQPMSVLIHEAMQEARRRGCKHWNWGGTWLTQEGVYRFKSRWGTVDWPYHYYIREHQGPRLRACTREELLASYPYFYVLPFSALA